MRKHLAWTRFACLRQHDQILSDVKLKGKNGPRFLNLVLAHFWCNWYFFFFDVAEICQWANAWLCSGAPGVYPPMAMPPFPMVPPLGGFLDGSEHEAHWQSSTRRCHARHSFMLRNFWSVVALFAWLQCRCQFTELSSILREFASHCRSIFKVAQLQCGADCGPLQSKLRRTKAGIDGGIHG